VAYDTEVEVGDPLQPERVARIRQARDLRELATLIGADSVHDAYVDAKRSWAERPVRETGVRDGLPGRHVRLDDVDVFVHGITHANTDAERSALRRHVSAALDDGCDLYCEQGIREMYLADVADACAMDDYRWAMARCGEADLETLIDDVPTSEFEGLIEDLAGLSGDVREATFSLIESGSDVYGEEFASAIGHLASDVLTSHEDLATGEDFEAFQKTRRAAADPRRLADLQAYYRRSFLPQPLERDWLRRHDRKLELLTHARNERMADYVAHDAQADAVEVICGAAHQPGLTYYLQQYRDGHRQQADFSYVE
jgi:hypothetical protein